MDEEVNISEEFIMKLLRKNPALMQKALVATKISKRVDNETSKVLDTDISFMSDINESYKENEGNTKDETFVTADDENGGNKGVFDDSDIIINSFKRKTIEGNGKCGFSAVAYAIRLVKGTKISILELLKSLHSEYIKAEKSNIGREIQEMRKRKNKKKFNGKSYWKFLQEINETEVVAYDKYLIDAEMNLLAKAHKLNMIIIPNNLIQAAPKHYFYGSRDERIVFVRHVGVHYDVLLLDKNSVYMESELIKKKSCKVSGKIENLVNTNNYTVEDFWKINEEVLLEHEYEYEDNSKEVNDKNVKHGRKDWTEELETSTDESNNREDSGSNKNISICKMKKKGQRASLNNLADFRRADYTGLNLNQSFKATDHRKNQRRLSGNDFDSERELVRTSKERALKDLLLRSKSETSKLPDGGDDPSDSETSISSNDSDSSKKDNYSESSETSTSDSSSDSNLSSDSSRYRNKEIRKKVKNIKKKKKHNKRHMDTKSMFQEFLKYVSNDRNSNNKVVLKRMSVDEMKRNDVFLSEEEFRKLKSHQRIISFSKFIDDVKAFKRDLNNRVFDLRLASTICKEVKEFILNEYIIKYGAMHELTDNGKGLKLREISDINNLSDELLERLMIIVTAPTDLNEGRLILKSLNVIPDGKDEYYKEAMGADLSLYGYSRWMELAINYMKRYESLYLKMAKYSTNKEAVPDAYSRNGTYNGGIGVKGAIDIMALKLSDTTNNLIANIYNNLTSEVKANLKDRNPKRRSNPVSRYVQYMHRALLQVQHSVEGVKTTLGMGRKRLEYNDKNKQGLKILQREKDKELESDFEKEFEQLQMYHDENKISEKKKLFEPIVSSSRKLAAESKKKLPCFLMGNCVDPIKCGYSHEIHIYENFMKTIVEYVKLLKEKAPNVRIIEDYLEHEGGYNGSTEEANTLTDFMAVCMKIVNEQLTPAHVATEVIDENGDALKGRQY